MPDVAVQYQGGFCLPPLHCYTVTLLHCYAVTLLHSSWMNSRAFGKFI